MIQIKLKIQFKKYFFMEIKEMWNILIPLLGKAVTEVAKEVDRQQSRYYENHLSKNDIEFVNAIEEGLKEGGYLFPNSVGVTYEHFTSFIFLLKKVDPEKAKMHEDRYYSKRLF